MKKSYFFYRRNFNNSFYDITLEAWYGEPTHYHYEDIDGESFTQLEKLHLFACKNHSHKDKTKRFHCLTLQHEKNENSGLGINAKTEKEFLDKQVNCPNYPMEQISQRHFLMLKKKILGIYNEYPDVDYENYITNYK